MNHDTENAEELRIAAELFEEGRHEKAFDKYVFIAQRGDMTAQVFVGWMYHAGQGVAKNLEAAEKWYKKAADANSAAGQFYLATLYRAKHQYALAMEWLQKAVSQGYSPAIYLLGQLYYVGEGVELDRERAFEYFEQAARQGHLFAKRNIAYDMIKGRRGLQHIPFGLFLMFQILWAAVRVGWRDPDSDWIRRQ